MTDSPKMKITTMIEMTSNPLDQFSEFQIGLKRSADLTEEQWLDQDAELQHVIAVCDSRIPFISLEDALRNEEIPHSGIVSEQDGAATSIKLLKFPAIPDASPRAMKKLDEQFLSLSFRLSTVKDNRIEKIGLRPNHMYWMVEVVMCPNNEIVKRIAESHGEQKDEPIIERVSFAYEAEPNESFEKINVLAEFQKDWACILKLYQLLLELLDDQRPQLKNKWSLQSFDYHKLVIAYGDVVNRSGNKPTFSSIVQIKWDYAEGAVMRFGEIRGNSAANPHSIALLQFQNTLNQSKSLSNILLQITYSFPLCRALGRLPVHCSVGTVDDNKQVGVSPTHQKFVARQNFSIICESPCHYRMFFRGYYCLEFVVNGESKIFIRDGAHSRFSNSKILEGLNPISGLIPFFCNGRQLPDDIIGEHYIRNDDNSSDLPAGNIWAGAEGATFDIEVVKHLLMPTNFNLGSDGFHGSQPNHRIVSISPLEQFLSASYILEFIRRYIRTEIQQTNRPNSVQVSYYFNKKSMFLLLLAHECGNSSEW